MGSILFARKDTEKAFAELNRAIELNPNRVESYLSMARFHIVILDEKGEFVEFVSADNNFTASIPLDIASPDGKTIYAANPADSKLYVFKRRP
jgi:hypothetical protein